MNIIKIKNSLNKIKSLWYREEISLLLDTIDKTKEYTKLNDKQIELFIDKWYTFSEILAWWFNNNWIFEPKEIITVQAKTYLLQGNEFNTYANQ